MLVCASAAAAGGSASSGDDEEGWESNVTCAPAFVMADQSNPHYSAFSIDVSGGLGVL
jgi:hypothetical protein